MNIICLADIKRKGKDIKKSQLRSGKREYLWAYFGGNQEMLKSIGSLCGNKKRLKLGDSFHVIAKKIKPRYLEYISCLSNLNQSSVLWWASGIASKSPFMSQFFKLLCYRELIIQHIKKYDNLIIFIEDPFLFEMMKNSFSIQDIEFIGKTYLHPVSQIFRSISQRFWVLMYLMILKFKILFIPDINLSSINTMLFSWINQGCFNEKGLFVDHYLGALKSYLDKKREITARLTFSFFSRRQIDEIKKAREPFAVSLRYVSLWQIIRSVSTIFYFKYDGCKKFEGLDVSGFIQREMFMENKDAEFVKHILFYEGLRKIFRRSNNLRTVFHPFEGQPWEKLLALAAKSERSEVKIFGHQHSSFSPFLLNYFLGPNEANFNPLPDMVLTNSEYNRQRLIEGGFPERMVSNIGALRFSYVFELDKKYAPIKGHSVLICLPCSYELAFEMLSDIIPTLNKLKKEGVLSKIMIKPHPLTAHNILNIQNDKELVQETEFVLGKLTDELANFDIMLYCNGTVGIEGLYANKKLIKYLPELEFDLDPLALIEDKFFIKICSRGELEKVILDIISESDEGVHFNKNMFDPVDYSKIDELIEYSNRK